MHGAIWRYNSTPLTSFRPIASGLRHVARRSVATFGNRFRCKHNRQRDRRFFGIVSGFLPSAAGLRCSGRAIRADWTAWLLKPWIGHAMGDAVAVHDQGRSSQASASRKSAALLVASAHCYGQHRHMKAMAITRSLGIPCPGRELGGSGAWGGLGSLPAPVLNYRGIQHQQIDITA
jgi:hypothetical protein